MLISFEFQPIFWAHIVVNVVNSFFANPNRRYAWYYPNDKGVFVDFYSCSDDPSSSYREDNARLDYGHNLNSLRSDRWVEGTLQTMKAVRIADCPNWKSKRNASLKFLDSKAFRKAFWTLKSVASFVSKTLIDIGKLKIEISTDSGAKSFRDLFKTHVIFFQL